MSTPVHLYVYDLSNGLARQLSQQFIGRLIEGIWHTSIVVFGKEIFYGQGIMTTQPGKSHHGTPLEKIDMGSTAIDEDTFNDYIAEMRNHYTADKYHLLDFNCNSFTNDCIGFLTGGSIPSHIKDLPSDFLSTPFGAALRPTIDSMYRRPAYGEAPSPPPPPPINGASAQLANSLLGDVANRASGAQNLNSGPPAPVQTLTASLHTVTNPASFRSLLGSHRVVVALFTNPTTCPPCRIIDPVFDDLAKEMAREGVAFAKIDLAVGMANQVAAQWSIRATPTTLFILDGKQIHELKGPNVGELRTQSQLIIYSAFPPHPHARLSVPAIKKLSLSPILFSARPNLDAAYSKLESAINSSPALARLCSARETISIQVMGYLKTKYPPPGIPPVPGAASASRSMLTAWARSTKDLFDAIPPTELFPLVDMWRIAVLSVEVAAFLTSPGAADAVDPLNILFNQASTAVQNQDASTKNFVLTFLRFIANTFASSTLTLRLLSSNPVANTRTTERERLASDLLIPSLLHDDVAVRTAAASVAFNVAAEVQKRRSASPSSVSSDDSADQGDWESEIITAVIEAISRENTSEDILHRLSGSLALLLFESPAYESQHHPLLEVLNARGILEAKLAAPFLQKFEVKRLVKEVAEQLCP